MIEFKNLHVNEGMKIFIAITLCVLAGLIGSIFTVTGHGSWYSNINKPSFNPPNWLFGPVWTTLYILMGISLFLIWKQAKSKERNLAILIFLIQLVLNFAWSFIFFYFKECD